MILKSQRVVVSNSERQAARAYYRRKAADAGRKVWGKTERASWLAKHPNHEPPWKMSPTTRYRRYRLAAIKLLGGWCRLCGWHAHPWGLEFDHIDRTTKQFNPTAVFQSRSWRFASAYLKTNCQLLCSTCHRLKTAAFGDATGKPNEAARAIYDRMIEDQ